MERKNRIAHGAIKLTWGIAVSALALPTAIQTSLALPGALSPVIALLILGTLASSPAILGIGFALDDFKR